MSVYTQVELTELKLIKLKLIEPKLAALKLMELFIWRKRASTKARSRKRCFCFCLSTWAATWWSAAPLTPSSPRGQRSRLKQRGRGRLLLRRYEANCSPRGGTLSWC